MTTDSAPASSPRRRLIVCLGFAACWLGAAVTGFQATAGDNPAPPTQVAQARAERVDFTTCDGCAAADLTAPQAKGLARRLVEQRR